MAGPCMAWPGLQPEENITDKHYINQLGGGGVFKENVEPFSVKWL
jgi:hypothetical protein